MPVHEVMCKSALTKSNLPAADYALNPYVGCSHSCRYCYASFMRRFTKHGGEKWGSFVDVRVNMPTILARELRTPRKGTVLFGSVTDCYQPLEQKYQLTRKCLEVLGQRKSGLLPGVLTKSELITRDADLLSSLGAEAGLTITSLEESVSRAFEPGASLPKQRIEALRQLHEAGVATYVFIGPILPGLTNMREILKAVKGSVGAAMAEALNLRSGGLNCEEVYQEHFPEQLKEFRAYCADPRNYATRLREEFEEACQENDITMAGFFLH